MNVKGPFQVRMETTNNSLVRVKHVDMRWTYMIKYLLACTLIDLFKTVTRIKNKY